MENEHIMQFFAFDHLPEKLQSVSRPFGKLAQGLCPRTQFSTLVLGQTPAFWGR